MFLDCVMKCPKCGHTSKEEMTARYKEMEYLCKKCGFLVKATAEECCVYCAHSNMICPTQQEKRNCCPGDE